MKKIKNLLTVIALVAATGLAFAFKTPARSEDTGWFPYVSGSYELEPDPDIEENCLPVAGICAGEFEIDNEGKRTGDLIQTRPGVHDSGD